MSYLIEVPVEEGGRLVVQLNDDDLPGDLVPASRRPGETITKAKETLEEALATLKPAISAIGKQLAALSPDEVTVEFGLLLGAETGVIVAKGTTEVHFTVSVTWHGQRATRASADD